MPAIMYSWYFTMYVWHLTNTWKKQRYQELNKKLDKPDQFNYFYGTRSPLLSGEKKKMKSERLKNGDFCYFIGFSIVIIMLHLYSIGIKLSSMTSISFTIQRGSTRKEKKIGSFQPVILTFLDGNFMNSFDVDYKLKFFVRVFINKFKFN